MRLVDADTIFNSELLLVSDKAYDAVHAVIERINNAPTVDPVKHGHWINKGFEPVRCSVCGITVDAINGIPWAIKSFKYCPYCGAKMDEVEDDI